MPRADVATRALSLLLRRRVFEAFAFAGFECPGVRGDFARVAVYGGDGSGEAVGVGDGQGVDDSGAGQGGQVVYDPGEAFDGG